MRTVNRSTAGKLARPLLLVAALFSPALASATITLADIAGTAPATAAPGSTAQVIGYFSLRSNANGESISGLTVRLGSIGGIAAVEIFDSSNAALRARVTNPSGTDVAFSFSQSTPRNTTINFQIRIDALDHASMPVAPGGAYTTNAYVLSVSSANTVTGADVADGDTVIDNASPGDVGSLSGVPGNARVDLSWTNPPDADLAEILVLRRAGAAVSDAPVEGTTYSVGNSVGSATVACVVSAPDTTCGDTTASNGTAYYYRAFARDTYVNYSAPGTSAGPYTPALPPPPPAPGTPSASSQTTTSMGVSWTASTGATSYTLEVYTDDTFTTLFNTYTPATNSQSVTGLSSNTLYWMRVSATGTGGTSEWSGTGIGTTVPGAPGQPSFSGTTSSGTTVSWAAPGGNGTITSYSLDRATDSGFTANLVTTNGITGTSTPVSGLAASTTYWFRVRATNAAGTSIESAPNSVTTSASARTLLATGSDPTPSAPLCPGGEAAYVDQFVFSSDPTADTVDPLDVALGAGAGAAVALVEIRDATGTALAPARSEVPAADTVTFDSALLPSPTGAGTTYRLYVTPRLHALLAAGDHPVSAHVSAFTPATHPAQGSDAASTFSIDNAPLADATWGTVTPGNNQIELAWTNPAADSGSAVSHVVVLRRQTSTAFTEALDDGTTPPGVGSTTAGGSRVVYSQAGSAGAPVAFTDSAQNGLPYVYRVYVLDACGNWNAGAATGPHTPAGTFRAEGSTVAGAPMVSIVNPLKGTTVSGTFRVQIRVYNSAAEGGIAGLTPDSLAWSTDDGATWQTSGVTPLAGGTATGQTYEVQLTPPSAGPYALRARVSNAKAANVLSNSVPIVFRTAGGSGTLLVRDNSSQLCSDCHALMGHTSETTGSARGSWSTTCRDCHTPHGTKNIALIAESITPPAVTGPTTPQAVVFYNKDGKAASSYASTAGNGPCQVCHTRTTYYAGTGGAPHYETPCAGCHKHTKGLAASCTGCHGTEGRESIAGADAKQPAAPPVVAPLAVVFSAGGGAHVAHVNQATLRGAPLQCANCHPSPNVHQLDLELPSQTDVAWPGLASAGGVTPAPAAGALASGWPGSPGCTNYCHGASLARGGGANRNPGWISGPSHAACGTCHAVLPPVGGASAGVHPQNQACATCHGAGYGYAAGVGSLTDPARAVHIDGTLDRPNGCTACHGNLTGTSGVEVASGSAEAAPGWDSTSVDTHGSSDRAQIGVGAHVKHVNAGMMTGKACGVCHGSTPVDGNESHANASVAIGWNTPANAGGVASPTWSSGSCTNYCHSSGRPIGGTASLRPAISWTSTTALGCGDCHAATPATHAHARHASTYGMGCVTCHDTSAASSSAIVAGGGAHVSGGNDVDFDGTDSFVAPGGYNATLYTCASTYCHSDGTDRNPSGGFAANTSRAWNAGSGGCTACHQAGTALATPSHPAHVNQAGTYATTYGCQTCHAGTTSNGSDIVSTTLHVDMAADVDAGHSYSSAAKSCATYCHSSGQATPQVYSDMAWGTPLANDCKQCHGRYSPADPGFASTFGAPNYVSGGTAAANANSHKKHVSSGADCYVCHESTANTAGDAIATGSTTHLDGSRQVDFNATKAGASASYSNDANKRCSNVSCHGAGQPQWGGPAQACDSCHFGTNDSDDFVSISNDTASVISSGEWAARGHGQSSGFEEFGAVTNRCVYCHDDQNASANHKQSGNPFRLRGAADGSGATALYDASVTPDISACLNCHAVTGANGVDPDGGGPLPQVGPANARIDAYHYGATDHTGVRNGGRRCWDCHDPHGDGSNLAMIGSDTLPAATDLHGFAGTRSATDAVLTSRAAGGYANTTTRNGICQVCHTTTDYWRSTSEPADHNDGTDCISCHTHQQPPNNAFQGAGACSACHMGAASASADTDRNEFPPQYNVGGKSLVDPEDWALTGHGHPAAGSYDSGNPGAGFPVTATVEGCYYCHAPDTALWASGESSKHADVASTNPFRLLNTGGGTNRNGVCLVCHAPGSPGFDPDGGALSDYASINRTTSRAISATHHGASHAAGDGGGLCWDCHDPHGDWNYGNGRAIAYMVQAQPSAASDAWGATITVTGQIVDFNKALGVNAAAFDGGDYVRAASPYTGVCQVCHTSTSHWTSTAPDTHQNGGARCVSCHAHEQTPDLAFKQIDATNNCGACHPRIPGARHASHLSDSPSQTYGDTAIHSTEAGYDFGCGQCHDPATAVHYDDQGGTAGDPYRADVAFDLNNGTAATYPAIVQPPTATQTGATGLVFGWQNGTCSNTYCHDPLGAGYAATAVSWNTTATVTCTMCHDGGLPAAATALPGAHGQHVRLYANDGYQYGCEKCHDDTVSDYQTLRTTANQGRAQHVDNDKNDVRFNASPISQTGGTFSGGTTGTCSNTYCHSNGQDLNAADGFVSSSPAWNTTGSCTSCHGAGGGASTTLTVSHDTHVLATGSGGYAYDCDRCHNATGSGAAITNKANHVDADANHDVAFNSLPIAQTLGTYDPAAKTCAGTYCHSNGQDTSSPFTSTSAAWGTSAACDSCHDDGGAATTTLSGAHLKHVGSITAGYAYGCERCHVNTGSVAGGITGKANHVDADFTTHDVAFNSSPLNQTAGTYAVAGLTCSNTYCHSNGQDRVAPFTSGASIAWTDTNTTCTGCHGGNATSGAILASNAHGAHVNNGSSTYIQTNYGCAQCHPSTASDDRTILNPGGYTAHVNGAAEATGYTDGTADQVANGSCATTYCHSAGSGHATPAYYTATWNVALANDCKQCHGRYSPADPLFTNTYGAPNYTGGAAGSATANSHRAHVDAAADCYTCHTTSVSTSGTQVPTSATAHLDGNPDVSLNTANGSVGATATYTAGKTCNNVVCHGGAGSTVVWGATLDCSGCHMGVAGATTESEVDNYNYGDLTVAKIDPEDWINYGHGRPSGNYDSGNGPAAFDTAAAVSSDDGCKYCHDKSVAHGQFGTSSNPFRLANVGAGNTAALKNGVCTVCHGGSGYTPPGGTLKDASKDIDAQHYGADHTAATATFGGQLCWDCHDPHGDSRYTSANGGASETPLVAANELLGHMIDAKLVRTHNTAEGNTTEWGTNGTTGPTLAGKAPVFRANLSGGATTYDWGDYAIAGANYNGVCQVCHTKTSRFKADGTTWSAASPDSGHNTGQNCTTLCHTHDQAPTDAFKGKGTCIGCHGGAQGPRVGVTGDFVRESRHVSNGTTTSIVTNYDCILCHAEGDVTSQTVGGVEDIKTAGANHGNDGGTTTVDLRDVDSANGTGIAAAWTGTRGTPLANGSAHTAVRDAMDTFCMNCHDADGAATVAVKATDDGMLTGTGYWINANAGQVSRTTNVVTVNTAAAHGLAVNNTVILEVPTEAGFPPGVKTVTSVPTTTRFTYAETAANATSTRALKFIRAGQSNSGQTSRPSGSARVTVNTTQAHGFVAGDKVLLRTGSNNTTSGITSYTHSYYFRAGVKTVVTASGTQFTYDEDTTASPNPTANQTSNQILLFTKSIDRAVTPFNSADRLQGSTREGAALKAWRWQANGRLIDVKSQFNSANAVGTEWASHHNLNQFTKRYGSRNATAWQDAAWTTWTTRQGDNIQTAGETAGLHCSDCHLNETSAHGTSGNYYMLSDSAGDDLAFSGASTTSSTENCMKCHAASTYGIGNNSLAGRTESHGYSGGRCQNWTTTRTNLVALSGTGTTPNSLTCLACHGGLAPGLIHGTNNTYNPGKSGTWTSKMYRFMGTGGAMRWYSPNNSTTGDDNAWTSSSGGCYTVDEALDTFGGCSNHNSGLSGDAASTGRPRALSY